MPVCLCVQDGKTGMELAKQKSSESQAHSKCFNALKDAAKTLVYPQTFLHNRCSFMSIIQLAGSVAMWWTVMQELFGLV